MIRRLTIGFCLLAIVLAAAQAWTARFEMNPDGVQYLDNADAYRSGDFAHALNSQWSPLYPWLIAAASAAFHPTPDQEFPMVHALNFVLFLLTLAGFLCFTASARPLLGVHSISFLLIGYSAFLCCSLDLTHLRYVAPDLLVNLFAFVAAGLLIRIATGVANIRDFAALGLALGLGYLAKTPVMLLGFLCLGLAFLLARKHRRALARVGLAAALFAAIVAPYVWLLSAAKGRLTFGDSGTFNIIWKVNGVPYRHWQGGPPGTGRPIHPTRQLAAHPAVFEFATPVAGTYPPWYDPIYWNEGARIALRPGEFIRAMQKQIRLYAYLVHHRQTPLLVAWIATLLLVPSQRRLRETLQPVWPVLVLGAAPFAMYAPIHAEGRYLAPFFVVLWTALFAALLPAASKLDRRVPLAVTTAAALLMLGETLASISPSAPIDVPAERPARLYYDIAHGVESLGLKPGDRVAIVTGDLPYYWARLARARITMEISFTDPSEWDTAKKLAASNQVAFVVAPAVPGITTQPGWHELGRTGVFAYRLQP